MSILVKLAGQNIREQRKKQHLTQEQLAEKCNVKTTYIAGVERGERNITLQSLEKISDGLKIPASELLKMPINGSLKDNNFEQLFAQLHDILSNRNETEVRLILNFATEIFNLYKSGKS